MDLLIQRRVRETLASHLLRQIDRIGTQKYTVISSRIAQIPATGLIPTVRIKLTINIHALYVLTAVIPPSYPPFRTKMYRCPAQRLILIGHYDLDSFPQVLVKAHYKVQYESGGQHHRYSPICTPILHSHRLFILVLRFRLLVPIRLVLSCLRGQSHQEQNIELC